MCNALAAAVIVTALSSAAEGYSDSQKTKAEGRAVNEERKRQARFMGESDAIIGKTLDDHSEQNREQQQAQARAAEAATSDKSVDTGVDLVGDLDAANAGVQAGGQVTTGDSKELARQTANSAKKSGRGRAAISAPGLASFRRSNRARDDASRRKDVAVRSEASLGLLPFDLRSAATTGSGTYTLAQLGKVGASGLAAQGNGNGAGAGTYYRV
jgi:hypothetical protein